MTTLEIHPIANLLPKMPADDFAALRDDIQANGCHTPIVLFEGQILDGRHRYLACQETGRDFTTHTYREGDPVGFVRSLNLHRRNLTPSQRALVEVALSEWLERGRPDKSAPGADYSQTEKPAKTSAEMAKSAEVGTRTIERAKTVAREASPEVKDAVTQGEMSLKAAVRTIPAKPRPAPVAKEKPAAKFPADVEKAIVRLGRLCGPSIEEAYRIGVIKPQDIASINGLKDSEIIGISRLVCRASGWTVKKALKFTTGTIDAESKIVDLIHKCIAASGHFSMTIDGHLITVIKEGGYK